MNKNCLNNKPINDPKEFLGYLNSCHINNTLIGNGFCLSHPILKSAFEWNLHQALYEDFLLMLPSKSCKSPESDLENIRKRIVIKILRYYTSNILSFFNAGGEVPDSLNGIYKLYMKNIGNKYECIFSNINGIGGSKNIFTLNYDPLLYFEILRNKRNFFDGFVSKNDPGIDGCIKEHYEGEVPKDVFLNQKYISCKLKKETKRSKILFIHGSWFIQANEKDELRKLQFDQESEDTIEGLFEDRKRPYLILEDRWRVKKAFLEASDINPYLSYCYSQLKEIKGNLLIFGCSFNKDDHIVEAIADNLKKEDGLQKVHICYLDERDKESIQKKFSEVDESKITFVSVSENVIWQEVGPSTNL